MDPVLNELTILKEMRQLSKLQIKCEVLWVFKGSEINSSCGDRGWLCEWVVKDDGIWMVEEEDYPGRRMSSSSLCHLTLF